MSEVFVADISAANNCVIAIGDLKSAVHATAAFFVVQKKGNRRWAEAGIRVENTYFDVGVVI